MTRILIVDRLLANLHAWHTVNWTVTLVGGGKVNVSSRSAVDDLKFRKRASPGRDVPDA